MEAMMFFENFYQQFHFNTQRAFYIGIERERFVTDIYGIIVPQVQEVLESIYRCSPEYRDLVGYEFSACQLEDRTKPCKTSAVYSALKDNDRVILKALECCRLSQYHAAVAPRGMPYDVYPDRRYIQVAEMMNQQRKEAACRVASTHIHIGLPDHDTALHVYNYVIRCGGFFDKLLSQGVISHQRLRLYKKVAPFWKPVPYNTWTDFYCDAQKKCFSHNSSFNWALVRLTKHGTIEFRIFDAIENVKDICFWAQKCHSACLDAVSSVSLP